MHHLDFKNPSELLPPSSICDKLPSLKVRGPPPNAHRVAVSSTVVHGSCQQHKAEQLGSHPGHLQPSNSCHSQAEWTAGSHHQPASVFTWSKQRDNWKQQQNQLLFFFLLSVHLSSSVTQTCWWEGKGEHCLGRKQGYQWELIQLQSSHCPALLSPSSGVSV